MAKGKRKKRRYTIRGTRVQEPSKPEKKTKRITLPTLLAVASLLASTISPPPLVDFVLTAITGVLLWFAAGQLVPFFARKYIRYLGCVLILAAILVLAWLSPREVGDAPKDRSEKSLAPPAITTTLQDSPGSSVVTSQGQAGGITAQTVIQNPIINNYFTNQTPDQKEEWRQYLNKKYPLGWAMHATDGKDIHTPPGLSHEDYFSATWNSSGVVELTPDTITLQFPDIDARGINVSIKGYRLTVKRQVGTYPWRIGSSENISVVADILKDEGDFVVFAVGFRKLTEAESRE